MTVSDSLFKKDPSSKAMLNSQCSVGDRVKHEEARGSLSVVPQAHYIQWAQGFVPGFARMVGLVHQTQFTHNFKFIVDLVPVIFSLLSFWVQI